MSKLECAFLSCAVSAFCGLGAFAQWSVGERVTIAPGTSLTVNSAQPNILSLTNNGTLIFESGGSVSIMGSATSVTGADGETGVMTVRAGGAVTSTNAFTVGLQGGDGTLTVETGGTFDLSNAVLSVAGNIATDMRILTTRGTLNVGGWVRGSYLAVTPFFPNAVNDPYATAGEVNLLPGGVLEVSNVNKNDHAYSYFNFKGGTVKARASGSFNVGGNGGVLYYVIDTGCEARFDTAGYNVTFTPASAGSFLNLTGAGGLRKLGAGSLVFTLADTNNTFTGNIIVEQGILSLGRPLYQGQTVTVHQGATFLINTTNDLPNIIYLGAGPRLFTVSVDLTDFDLAALSPTYYADRLGGPFSGAVTLRGPLAYDPQAGTALNPFRLISQGGTLYVADTGLENAFVQIEGPSTIEFQGNRTFTHADTGKIRIVGDGLYQQRGLFTMAGTLGTPAQFAVEGPARFATVGGGNALEVGRNGDAVFCATNATVNIERLRVGSGFGVQAEFIQRGGTVTTSAESWIGYDNGTGRLDVANGNLIINGSLRVAGSPGNYGNTRPDGTVVVSNGLVRCGEINFTPWWPTGDTSIENLDVGRAYLLDGGTLEASFFNKNDTGISTVYFDGGLVRARQSDAEFIRINQRLATLAWAAPAGQSVILDTQGYTNTIPSFAGKFKVTGGGGFKKRGTGTLELFTAAADYLGDTVVEAGILRLLGNNVLPYGPGKGNLILTNVNTRLDLNGRDVTLNRILGPGLVVNTSGQAATLALLADGSDDTWSHAITGPIALDKRGAGTLTLSGRDIAPARLTVSEGTVRLAPSVGYPFYRFKVEDIKGANAGMMQICEFELYDNGVNVTPARTNLFWDTEYSDAVTGNQTYPPAEAPPNAVNGNKPNPSPVTVNGSGNKWLDYRASRSRSLQDRDRVWIRLDFPGAQRATGYNWLTSNDSPERDPSAWRLQGSYNGDDWTDLHTATGAYVTDWRFQWATGGPGEFPVDTSNVSGRTLAPGTPVTLASGATLLLDGVSETIGPLSGYGTVTLNGGDLTIDAAPGASGIFAGTLQGNGTVIKTGAGTQTLNGAATFTGDLIVREGTAEIALAPFDWFRLTIKGNRGPADVLQISELALYDAGGTRRNLNLANVTQPTDITAMLSPGQAATPPGYPLGSGDEHLGNLFDNNTGTKWCTNLNTPRPADPATWRTIVMRLAAGSPEIASYNLATANDFPDRDPVTWTLEGSLDGQRWTPLDAQTGFIPTTTRFTWYNSNTPLPIGQRATGAPVLPPGGTIEVQAGATLSVIGGTLPISALRVDMAAGAGTINRFTPAPNGALYLTHTSGNPSSWVIPVTFGVIDNLANLATWTPYADGQPLRGYRLSYANGILRLRPKGTIILLK